MVVIKSMLFIVKILVVSYLQISKEGGAYMPDITNGRDKVNAFLKDKGIKKTTLAVAYGFKRQEVTNILSGTTKGPRANSFILQVIEDYGIE
nr:MAG TPA: protein-turn-helix DNA binding protein [Caudoviricetes sp.]